MRLVGPPCHGVCQCRSKALSERVVESGAGVGPALEPFAASVGRLASGWHESNVENRASASKHDKELVVLQDQIECLSCYLRAAVECLDAATDERKSQIALLNDRITEMSKRLAGNDAAGVQLAYTLFRECGARIDGVVAAVANLQSQVLAATTSRSNCTC